MEGMMLHRGGQEIAKADLDLIETPKATDSYTPVSHFQLADRISTISRDILTDYVLVGEKYAVARQGQQMFAFLQFKKDVDDIGLSVAFRNSYDRSMSVGLAIGASVFVCDNLSLTGDIAIMRKHTKNVWATLEDLAISTIYKSQKNYQKILLDAERMKGKSIDDMAAFSMLGMLFGLEVLSPRQIGVVREEWLNPKHEAFQPRNIWSFYNACTEALKANPPTSAMEKYIELHKQFDVWVK